MGSNRYCHCLPQIRVSIFIRICELQRTQMHTHCPDIFSRLSMSSFKPCRRSLLSQLLKYLKVNCTWSKVNCGPHTVKLQDFWPTSSFWSLFHHLIKGWSWFLKDYSQFIKTPKLLNYGFTGKVNSTLTKHNFLILYQKFFL